jgi:hypothetical protein
MLGSSRLDIIGRNHIYEQNHVGAVRFTFSLEDDELVDFNMVTAADG